MLKGSGRCCYDILLKLLELWKPDVIALTFMFYFFLIRFNDVVSRLKAFPCLNTK